MDLQSRVAFARTRLVMDLPFLGFIIFHMHPRIADEEDNVDRFAVGPDGTILINERYANTLTDPEFMGALLHETLHPALLYWARLSTRVPHIFNDAHDHAINLIITSLDYDDISLPEQSLLNYDYHEMSAEEIYNVLLKKRKAVNKKIPPLSSDCRRGINSTDLGSLAASGNNKALDQLSQEWKSVILSAVSQYGIGSLPLGLKKVINDLTGVSNDWISIIKNYIGEYGLRSDYSYRKPSRRNEEDYLPSITRSLDQVAVIVDTSASISTEKLTHFMIEIQELCNSLALPLRTIVCDSEVHADLMITDLSELIDELRGDGGSNIVPAMERLESDGFSGIVIVFTDGQITVPLNKPERIREVIWALDPKDRSPADWGIVIRINNEKEV